MSRRVFFSFHYVRDVWRAAQVRNCNVLADEEQFGFVDAAEWQSIERQGIEAIKRWIEEQMKHTSVTAVLFGAETATREWVRHEILESWNRGNGIVGIRIHNIKDQHSNTDAAGANPFDSFELDDGVALSSVCKTYDWVFDDGRQKLGEWVEEAYSIRQSYGANEHITEFHKHAGVSVVPGAVTHREFAPHSPWSADAKKR